MIFDLDGVIVESELLSAKADEVLLSKYGIKKTDEEVKQAFGRRSEEIFGDVFKARKRKFDLKKIVEEKNETFTRLAKGKLKPIKNSLEVIDFFRKSGLKTR